MTSFAAPIGAIVASDGRTTFQVHAPVADRVEVLIERAGSSATLELVRRDDGTHVATVDDAPHGTRYRIRLDDGEPLPDPASRWQPEGVFGPSAVVDPRTFEWNDGAWRGVERSGLVLYELHVGTFTQAGTFEAAAAEFARLARLGVTAIELMPVSQFSGRRNWGYDGVFPFAPQDSYGGPAGLQRLVDAAHAAGLAVVLDVVYNHLGPEGNVLHEFAAFFTNRYRTPWGSAMNFDDQGSDAVRDFFLWHAIEQLETYHLDGLRLDAVHSIYDRSASPFLAELSRAVRKLEHRSGRPLHLIAESDLNDPRLLADARQHGLGMDAVWCDDFHHALHSVLTAERHGYYADFGSLDQLARSFRAHFVLDGGRSVHRGHRHGATAEGIPDDRFVVFSQNHDQIGNRAAGERLTTLVEPAAARLGLAATLLGPGLPLLFMGEEYGETRPFLYFVDHRSQELRSAVREGRRREFADFHASEEVPDPSAASTFEAARLARPEDLSGEQLATERLVGDLLALRREHAPLAPGLGRRLSPQLLSETTLAVGYDDGASEPLLAVYEWSGTGRDVELPGPALLWRCVLESRSMRYGGPELDARGGAVYQSLARSNFTTLPFGLTVLRAEDVS